MQTSNLNSIEIIVVTIQGAFIPGSIFHDGDGGVFILLHMGSKSIICGTRMMVNIRAQVTVQSIACTINFFKYQTKESPDVDVIFGCPQSLVKAKGLS